VRITGVTPPATHKIPAIAKPAYELFFPQIFDVRDYAIYSRGAKTSNLDLTAFAYGEHTAFAHGHHRTHGMIEQI
jgi:hypothetical protein